MNAFDDRSADALRSKVTDAVQMQPVIGDKRPNLVVIDETDGALGGAEGQGRDPGAAKHHKRRR